ncbi:MAG: hypothetical protein WAZ12_02145 [Candidatus Absconditicoccaceae bacterium]
MKKSIIIAMFIVLLTVTGCFSQKSNILTFEQSLDILNIQSNNLLDKYSYFFDYTGTIKQDIKINISSLDKEEPTNLSINSIISIDPLLQNYNSLIDYDVSLFDKTKNQKIISSGAFFYSNIEYVPYFKLNKVSLDMGTGNVESYFLKALLGGIMDKWIMVDIQDKKNLIQNYVDINYIIKDLSSLNKCQIFYKIRNTIYKSKRAYKIGLNQQNIATCINNPDYTGIVFEGFLTPTKDNQVLLEIKKLQLPDNKNLFISGEFTYKNLKIIIYNAVTKQTKSIVVEYGKKNDKIIFESPNYNHKINIDKIKDVLNFKGNLSLSTNNVKQTKLNFDIRGNLVLQNTGYLDIKSPQNYLIMSQLLGDKFSLKNIFGQ